MNDRLEGEEELYPSAWSDELDDFFFYRLPEPVRDKVKAIDARFKLASAENSIGMYLYPDCSLNAHRDVGKWQAARSKAFRLPVAALRDQLRSSLDTFDNVGKMIGDEQFVVDLVCRLTWFRSRLWEYEERCLIGTKTRSRSPQTKLIWHLVECVWLSGIEATSAPQGKTVLIISTIMDAIGWPRKDLSKEVRRILTDFPYMAVRYVPDTTTT